MKALAKNWVLWVVFWVLGKGLVMIKYVAASRILVLASCLFFNGFQSSKADTQNLLINDGNNQFAADCYGELKKSIGECSNNIGIGKSSFNSRINGKDNIAIGYSSLFDLYQSVGNVAIVTASLRHLKNGSYNIGIGGDTFFEMRNGRGNVGIGYDALHDLVSGEYNVSIGHLSGFSSEKRNIKNVSSTTWVGAFSGSKNGIPIENSIAIGFSSQNTKSNQVVIGNEMIKENIFYGTLYIDKICMDEICVDKDKLKKILNMLKG